MRERPEDLALGTATLPPQDILALRSGLSNLPSIYMTRGFQPTEAWDLELVWGMYDYHPEHNPLARRCKADVAEMLLRAVNHTTTEEEHNHMTARYTAAIHHKHWITVLSTESSQQTSPLSLCDFEPVLESLSLCETMCGSDLCGSHFPLLRVSSRATTDRCPGVPCLLVVRDGCELGRT